MVLVVDADPNVVEFLQQLWGEDIELLSAETLTSARRLLEHLSFDSVLLDTHLPDGRGTDLLSELRAGNLGPENQSASVVMLTESRSAQDYEEAWELGSSAYVAKPIFIPNLQAALQRSLHC